MIVILPKARNCFLRVCILFLLQCLGFTGLYAQVTQVKGLVLNAKGTPLSGVSVILKGTSTGTTTDSMGHFSLQVKGTSAVLTFSAVGYIEKEEPVNGRATMDVTLSESVSDLDDVVVIGYGTQKKRDVTGAISSITSKNIEERQPVNLFDALQGQAAGVLVTNDGGGAPGAEGTIQIRGASTLNSGNGPLYLVDGVITPDGASINPMDIDKIEVLKDAASAAIYGARAANGVIIITTKRGKEGKARIDLNYSRIFGKLAHKLPQNNAAQVREFRRVQQKNPTGSTGGNIDSLNPGFNSDNDLQELLLGNLGDRQQINLGVSGGQKGLNYYTGVNYLNDKSIIPNSYIKRVQVRSNIEYQASPKFKYVSNISMMYQTGNEIPIARTVAVAFDRPAYSLIYYPDGSLTSYVGSKRNPLANALLETNKTDRFSIQFSNSLQYRITKDLLFTNTFNAMLNNSQNLFFSPRYVSANKDQNNGSNDMQKTFSWEYQSFLNYNKTFGGAHNLQAVLGVSADKTRYDRAHSEYANVVSEEIFITQPSYLTASQTYTDADLNAGASLFARANYSYKGKYTLAGIFRRDGSSRFGNESRYGNFYSASGGWRFSDEPFMNWAKNVLTDGRFRIGTGQVGNDRIGSNDYLNKVTFTGGSYAGVGGAYTTPTFGNARVHWETTIQQDAGLDLTFFRGRLTFTTDYYIKTTKDLLYQKDLPGETGFDNVMVNLGTLENRGLEFSVKGTPILAKNSNRGVTWEIGGNISFEKSIIKKLGDGTPFIVANKWYIEEGGKIGNFYGWKNLGVYQWNESNAYNDNWEPLTVVLGDDGKPLYENGLPVYTFNGQRYTGTVHSMYDPGGKLRGGDVIWQNLNKDSLIDDRDRQILANAQPKFYLGILNNLTYRQFSLSFLVNASFGSHVYNALLYAQSYPSNTGAGSPEMTYNVWRQPGDIAKYPYYPEYKNRGNEKKDANSLFIEDGSFIRLSSLRLSYMFSPGITRKVFLKGATVYVYGTNLLTWTNYRGYDPEFSASNVLQPGYDNGKYPKRREYGFGINVNF
ncbi:SusC/RagA family TonB-linked outer membrane protein [Niabella ginsenosidivorans]|uniref:SusC/RagA family TonB-linked outer membrane protein n=1 Tax=Niabella ginsenosidivorans TaxID=1176587 RepID=A0A1A9I695_9BACT|nr:SusC/RagA family TonB-linked outer membrane protein [Niabella ginsenosidivorans]ANH82230.1 SusC/RagA family TonB-linked outer membrane protein [Niabella ginsenosidivorans]